MWAEAQRRAETRLTSTDPMFQRPAETRLVAAQDIRQMTTTSATIRTYNAEVAPCAAVTPRTSNTEVTAEEWVKKILADRLSSLKRRKRTGKITDRRVPRISKREMVGRRGREVVKLVAAPERQVDNTKYLPPKSKGLWSRIKNVSHNVILKNIPYNIISKLSQVF